MSYRVISKESCRSWRMLFLRKRVSLESRHVQSVRVLRGEHVVLAACKLC